MFHENLPFVRTSSFLADSSFFFLNLDSPSFLLSSKPQRRNSRQKHWSALFIFYHPGSVSICAILRVVCFLFSPGRCRLCRGRSLRWTGLSSLSDFPSSSSTKPERSVESVRNERHNIRAQILPFPIAPGCCGKPETETREIFSTKHQYTTEQVASNRKFWTTQIPFLEEFDPKQEKPDALEGECVRPALIRKQEKKALVSVESARHHAMTSCSRKVWLTARSVREGGGGVPVQDDHNNDGKSAQPKNMFLSDVLLHLLATRPCCWRDHDTLCEAGQPCCVRVGWTMPS